MAATSTAVNSPLPTPASVLPTPTDVDAALDPATKLQNAEIDTLVAHMSAAERVGQLFTVTFDGRDTGFESDIAQLIYAYHVGGVVLSPQHQNFSNAKGEDTPLQVAKLTNQLQAIVYGYLLPDAIALATGPEQLGPLTGTVSLAAKTGVKPLNVPLFIAVEQGGDDLPTTALRRNFTPLPTQMALGATWDPELTRKVGQIVGRELRAVGVNLLVGPNLDVVDELHTGSVGALGVQSFGGNPYWVSLLGHAYITGLHEGSNNRLAAVVGHFPGQGDIDRLPDQEVATVQKDSTELRNVALTPFFNVTRQPSIILRANGDPGAADGMMSSHTRYSALQGSSPGRAVPISLAQELSMMLNQGDFKDWRAGGGVLMSDALGVPAVRRYYENYEPALKDFLLRRVALAAFNAGHDILYLDEPQSGLDWPTRKQHIIETISFFQERYTSDPDFAAHVDESLRRILRLKLSLYMGTNNPSPVVVSGKVPTDTATDVSPPPLIPLQKVLVQERDLNVLNTDNRKDANKVMEQVARESITLLYPDMQQLSDALPALNANDHLLIFSDSRLVRECAKCTTETPLGPDQVAQIIDNLYGKKATGQVRSDQIVSRTFADLKELLEASAIQSAVITADVTSTITSALVVTPTSTVDMSDQPVETVEQSAEELNKNAKTERLITESNWLIFAMLNVDPERQANSDAVKQFLHQRSEQLGDKHVIVFALNAPYFLDATEISKLTAYFGVYSKTPPFLESAIRSLFRSYPPTGAPPVDVPGTRFGTLSERLKPDPKRPLELHVLVGDQELTAPGANDVQRNLNVGDTIRIRVGAVLDYNGRPVPDDTPVNIQAQYQSDPNALPIAPVLTHNSLVSRDLTLTRPGVLLISATAGEASTSKPLQINVQGPPVNNATSVAPTVNTLTPAAPAITATHPATTTLNTQPGEATPVPSSTPVNSTRVNVITLIIALMTIVITLSLLLLVQIWILPRHTLVRSMLWATIFGLMAYILYGIGIIPGANILRDNLHNLGPVVVVFIAMLLPLLWLQLRTEQPE